MGQVSYRSYWTRMILHTLHTHGHNLSIKEISDRTAIRTDDIVTTLQSLSLIKYWKGDHIIAVNSKQVSLRPLASSRHIHCMGSGLPDWMPASGPAGSCWLAALPASSPWFVCGLHGLSCVD